MANYVDANDRAALRKLAELKPHDVYDDTVLDLLASIEALVEVGGEYRQQYYNRYGDAPAEHHKQQVEQEAAKRVGEGIRPMSVEFIVLEKCPVCGKKLWWVGNCNGGLVWQRCDAGDYNGPGYLVSEVATQLAAAKARIAELEANLALARETILRLEESDNVI